MDKIYLCLAHMSGEEQKYIKEAFDTNWVVPLGPNVNAFEENLAAFVSGAGTDAARFPALSCMTKLRFRPSRLQFSLSYLDLYFFVLLRFYPALYRRAY